MFRVSAHTSKSPIIFRSMSDGPRWIEYNVNKSYILNYNFVKTRGPHALP